jgi:hypothetical protein
MWEITQSGRRNQRHAARWVMRKDRDKRERPARVGGT